MKFLCDRCKTRYSIGDDRVRGKILKIRCKNCANVITVREGMSDEGGVDEPPERRARPTTAAPNVAYSTAADGGPSALGAAFASQLTKPPPALEEEWYVSIDGDQSGPFSLADAQRWVATKAFDADLHCWSEGFDDWLPVDKVSHFRGLRKKPLAPAGPPPLPRIPTGPARTIQEEEPKPLFAATMASLEKTGGSDPKVSLPPPGSATPAKVASIPKAASLPLPAKTNGSPLPGPPLPAAAKTAATAKGTAKTPATGGHAGNHKGGNRAGTQQGVGLTAGAAALAAAFDASEQETGDSLTAVEAPPFSDEVETTAEPVAAKRAFDRVDSITDPSPANHATPNARAAANAPLRMPVSAPAPQPKVPPSVAEALEDDENLEIGEVSRVVKLADLAKMSTPKKKPAGLRTTGSVPRYSAAELADATTALAPGDGQLGQVALVDPAAGDSVVVPPIETTHRRGAIMLIAFAAVLLLGVAGAVVLLVTSGGDNDLPLGLGHQSQIDTSRPEDNPLRRNTPNDTGSGSAGTQQRVTVRRTCPPYCGIAPPTKGSAEEPTDPNLKRLEASEVEDYASKQNGGTQRCYMRAQKGVDGILVGDVKKVFVTLTIDKDGGVSDVQLSEHGADSLGKCLNGMIRRWKFRQSPGGTYKFALAFASG